MSRPSLFTRYEIWREDDNQAWLMRTFNSSKEKFARQWAIQSYKEHVKLYPTDHVWLEHCISGRSRMMESFGKPQGGPKESC